MNKYIKGVIVFIISIIVIITIGKPIYLKCADWYYWEYKTGKWQGNRYIKLLMNKELLKDKDINNKFDKDIEEINIPKVYINGDISLISKNNAIKAEMNFVSKEQNFTANTFIEWQGNSSLAYPKKNYSIDLINKDDDSKMEVTFNEWPELDGYHLKANYIDSTHARNIVTANLINSVYRNPLPNNSRGIIDGFAIKLYINNEYQGIYTWNLKQHRKVYGLSKDDKGNLMYRSDYHDGAGAFKDYSIEDINRVWENRHPKDGRKDHQELQRLIKWVNEATDTQFKEEINNYFNLDYLIDYFLICEIAGMKDNYNKNLNLVTYDGLVWYTTFYDLDSSWGLFHDGTTAITPTWDYINDFDKDYVSVLWEKLYRNFRSNISSRYVELRNTVFNKENIISEFISFYNTIGTKNYNEDKLINPGIPSSDLGIEYISQWINDRYEYLDKKYKRLD